jgi:hypothetical protein
MFVASITYYDDSLKYKDEYTDSEIFESKDDAKEYINEELCCFLETEINDGGIVPEGLFLEYFEKLDKNVFIATIKPLYRNRRKVIDRLASEYLVCSFIKSRYCTELTKQHIRKKKKVKNV